MEQELKNLRLRLLIFRWVGIALGLLAFPMPIFLISEPNGLSTGLLLVPVLVLSGIGCMIAGIVTRGKIKEVRALLTRAANMAPQNETPAATPAPTDAVTPVAKLKRDDK